MPSVGFLGADHREDRLEIVEFLAADDVFVAAHLGGHVMSPLQTVVSVVIGVVVVVGQVLVVVRLPLVARLQLLDVVGGRDRRES